MAPRTDHLRHQALCVTDDEAAVGAALALVLADPKVVGALVGPDADLTVELMPLPTALDGRLVPGTTSISLAVDDLEARIAACRAAGLDVTVGIGPGDLPYALVVAAGLEFELVGFS
jgi:orotate phosphoribosyltransferase-like protein